jgi:hypothetical protein
MKASAAIIGVHPKLPKVFERGRTERRAFERHLRLLSRSPFPSKFDGEGECAAVCILDPQLTFIAKDPSLVRL